MKFLLSVLRNRWVLIAFLLLAAGLAWKFWWHKPAAPVYQKAAVEYADLEETVQATGVLQPVSRVDVGAQVSGQLQKLHAQLGQVVKKGELLATIDPSIARNDMLNQDAALEYQAAQKESKQAELEQAKRELARQESMLANDATARTDVEQAASKVRILEAEIRALSAQMRQTQAGLETARTRLGYTQITAPMDGNVVNIVTQEGQTVIATQQAPTILTLARLDTMTVKAQVSEAEVSRLHPGQTVYFTTLGQSEQRHYGKLRTIQPAPEKINNAVFYSALFDVPNLKRELWTDMTVQVNFVVGEAKHALSVPVIALGDKDKSGRYAVRVLNADGSVSARRVRIALNDHVKAQVQEGLAAGEQVITAETAAGDAP